MVISHIDVALMAFAIVIFPQLIFSVKPNIHTYETAVGIPRGGHKDRFVLHKYDTAVAKQLIFLEFQEGYKQLTLSCRA